MELNNIPSNSWNRPKCWNDKTSTFSRHREFYMKSLKLMVSLQKIKQGLYQQRILILLASAKVGSRWARYVSPDNLSYKYYK